MACSLHAPSQCFKVKVADLLSLLLLLLKQFQCIVTEVHGIPSLLIQLAAGFSINEGPKLAAKYRGLLARGGLAGHYSVPFVGIGIGRERFG